MGMFDWISCEKSLPEVGVSNTKFQTKSFNNLLQRYTIDLNGVLMVQNNKVCSAPTTGNDHADNDATRYLASDYTGVVNFYSDAGASEFYAFFLSGQMVGEILALLGRHYYAIDIAYSMLFHNSSPFSSRFSVGGLYQLMGFSYDDFSKKSVILKDMQTGRNEILALNFFALNFESVYKQVVLNERTSLLDTKFRCGLTADETSRLQYVRWMLDCLDDIQGLYPIS